MERKNRKTVGTRRGLLEMRREEIPSDVLGSYTGIPADPDDDIPAQDADDL